MIGSLFIVEGTREQVEQFNKNDPFYIRGVWKDITISRWVSLPNGIKEVAAEMDDNDISTIRMVVVNK
jgi:hypothetical protein